MAIAHTLKDRSSCEAIGTNQIDAIFVGAQGGSVYIASELKSTLYIRENGCKFPSVRMFLPFLFRSNVVGADKGQGRIPTEMVRGLVGRDGATFHGILVLVGRPRGVEQNERTDERTNERTINQ